MKQELQQYLDYYLVQDRKSIREKVSNYIFPKAMKCESMMEATCQYEEDASISGDISTFIEKNKEEDTFQSKLLKWIDERNLKDSDVYNKVNIDRRLFSKIRSNKDYHPSKETIILLGLSLELSEQEIEELLESASYSLPMNNEYDLIIRFCFKKKIYDLFQINEFLEDHNCKTLTKGE